MCLLFPQRLWALFLFGSCVIAVQPTRNTSDDAQNQGWGIPVPDDAAVSLKSGTKNQPSDTLTMSAVSMAVNQQSRGALPSNS